MNVREGCLSTIADLTEQIVIQQTLRSWIVVAEEELMELLDYRIDKGITAFSSKLAKRLDGVTVSAIMTGQVFKFEMSSKTNSACGVTLQESLPDEVADAMNQVIAIDEHGLTLAMWLERPYSYSGVNELWLEVSGNYEKQKQILAEHPDPWFYESMTATQGWFSDRDLTKAGKQELARRRRLAIAAARKVKHPLADCKFELFYDWLFPIFQEITDTADESMEHWIGMNRFVAGDGCLILQEKIDRLVQMAEGIRGDLEAYEGSHNRNLDMGFANESWQQAEKLRRVKHSAFLPRESLVSAMRLSNGSFGSKMCSAVFSAT